MQTCRNTEDPNITVLQTPVISETDTLCCVWCGSALTRICQWLDLTYCSLTDCLGFWASIYFKSLVKTWLVNKSQYIPQRALIQRVLNKTWGKWQRDQRKLFCDCNLFLTEPLKGEKQRKKMCSDFTLKWLLKLVKNKVELLRWTYLCSDGSCTSTALGR